MFIAIILDDVRVINVQNYQRACVGIEYVLFNSLCVEFKTPSIMLFK